jgi:hypothetical protein
MRVILPDVMTTSISWCAETMPATVGLRLSEVNRSFGGRWTRTLLELRPRIKNLAGGLLVPRQVFDSQRLIVRGSY